MRKIVIAAVILGFVSTAAVAGWHEDFTASYSDKGIDIAVANAVKAGISPDMITEKGLAISELNPQNLVKALYCSGANGQDVRAALEKYDVSEIIITAGFQNSVEECGDQVADTQAYSATVSRTPTFAGTPGPTARPRRPASPSTP